MSEPAWRNRSREQSTGLPAADTRLRWRDLLWWRRRAPSTPRLNLARPRIAFQGEVGAYSEIAVRRWWLGNMLCVPQWEFEDVVDAVVEGRADLGVLPVDNSLVGSIDAAVQVLEGAKGRVMVVGETSLRIEHCLLGLPGMRVEALDTVASHPAALAQCRKLFGRYPNLRPQASYDTAGAARHVAAHGVPTEGAIASRRAAERYGLEVLLEGVGDSNDNSTKFVVVAARA